MAAALPVFSPHDQLPYFGHDPVVDYAQALAEEADRRQRGQEPEAANGTCLSPAVATPAQRRSAEEGKQRKSWKSSLFFWRRTWNNKKPRGGSASVIPAARHQTFKCRGRPNVVNGSSVVLPVYAGDMEGRGSPPRSYRCVSSSRSMFKDIPYLPLAYYHGRSGDNPCYVSARTPIYLVT